MSEEIQEETINQKWLDEEIKEVDTPTLSFEKLPSPKLEDGKITRMKVDCRNKFREWQDEDNSKVKAIIPVETTIDGKLQKANWWLNKKNPIYKDVIHLAKEKATPFIDISVMQIGKGQSTQYKLVKE